MVRQYTNKELGDVIRKILEEKGLIPDIMERFLPADGPEIEITSCAWEPIGELSYSFGTLFLDMYAVGGVTAHGKSERISLGTFQSESCFPSTTDKRQKFYAMAKLQADFILETQDFIHANLGSFTK